MFFNRHIKQGKEIGYNVQETLKSCIASTKFSKNGIFRPTKEFFDDDYIAGFLTSFVTLHMVFGLGGANWSSKKKVECVGMAFSVFDPYGQLQEALISQNNKDHALYQKGVHDAQTAIGVFYKKIDTMKEDPKYHEALSMSELLVRLGMEENSTDGMPAAIIMVTLRDYIQKKWGGE